MGEERSRQGFLDFLDYLSEKGLMERATVLARRAAASQILGILDNAEARDVTALNLGDLMSRFGRLQGRKYTPQTLSSYKSRLRSALDDFRAYLGNPLTFRPALRARERRPAMERASATAPTRLDQHADPRPIPALSTTGNVLPIPLRADLTVYIHGLPYDLSEAEARKISAIVAAFAQW